MSNEETLAGFQVGEFVPPVCAQRPTRCAPRRSSPPQRGAARSPCPARASSSQLIELLQAEHNPELMLLACRCLSNLVEALPQAGVIIIDNGAAPILTAKLLNIEYIDLAEQALTTMEKLSTDYGVPLLRAGGMRARCQGRRRVCARPLSLSLGANMKVCVWERAFTWRCAAIALSAVLAYLDFFSTGVQRAAVTIAANLCKRVPSDAFAMVVDALPVLTNLLRYQDARIVDKAVLAFSRYALARTHMPAGRRTYPRRRDGGLLLRRGGPAWWRMPACSRSSWPRSRRTGSARAWYGDEALAQRTGIGRAAKPPITMGVGARSTARSNCCRRARRRRCQPRRSRWRSTC